MDTSDECKREARHFLQVLRQQPLLGEAFAGEKEEISLTELIKRLVTYPHVATAAFGCPAEEIIPSRFDVTSGRIDSHEEQKPETIVWFMADGDRFGAYLKTLGTQSGQEAEARGQFSQAMRQWAAGLYQLVPEHMGPDRATVVYAGGDDLLGALHESKPGQRDLRRDHLFQWLNLFPTLWRANGQPLLTVSMGVVWADSSVPQREALQHVREAEATAKARGRNRFAIRLLYAGGNHLEWTCPWPLLEPILTAYRDREGRTCAHASDGKPPRWRHLAEDILWLRERHAIGDGASSTNAVAIAHGLIEAYFPGWSPPAVPEDGAPLRRLDHWLLDLSRVMAGLERWRDASVEPVP